MTSRAKSAKKNDSDDPASTNVRFDYSAIYIDNEDLAQQLEDHESTLHKEKYKMVVESELNLKKAKAEADAMLSLKNAVQRRNPNDSSSSIISRSESKRKLLAKQTPNVHIIDEKQEESDKNSEKAETETENTETEGAKPMHTLTMFLLSLRKFKSNRKRNDEKNDKKEPTDDPSRQRKASVTKKLPKRPSTVHGDMTSRPSVTRQSSADELFSGDKYGIHVKKDHSRSRRELETISRLEQNSKYGYVNKYEERRRRLLESCRDTKNLEDRISHFLKGVDDFKKLTSAENSLERVLMRSKSAHFARKSSMIW